MSKKLLTVKDVAEKLQVSPSWVRLRIYDNTLPVVRIGRLVRFSWPAVCKALGIETTHTDSD
jgi:excisionase family DNA binding protein